jgi:hypothetical protein
VRGQTRLARTGQEHHSSSSWSLLLFGHRNHLSSQEPSICPIRCLELLVYAFVFFPQKRDEWMKAAPTQLLLIMSGG